MTSDDINTRLAEIEAREKKATACDAEIKRLEEEHGIDAVKEARKGHKEMVAQLLGELRKAVKAGAPGDLEAAAREMGVSRGA